MKTLEPTREKPLELNVSRMLRVDRWGFDSVQEIVSRNKAAGFHFFDADTLRFFKSRILPEVIGGRLFITSEKYEDEARRYTVRLARTDGSVEEVSAFQEYKTAAAARARAVREGKRFQFVEQINHCWRVALVEATPGQHFTHRETTAHLTCSKEDADALMAQPEPAAVPA